MEASIASTAPSELPPSTGAHTALVHNVVNEGVAVVTSNRAVDTIPPRSIKEGAAHSVATVAAVGAEATQTNGLTEVRRR